MDLYNWYRNRRDLSKTWRMLLQAYCHEEMASIFQPKPMNNRGYIIQLLHQVNTLPLSFPHHLV